MGRVLWIDLLNCCYRRVQALANEINDRQLEAKAMQMNYRRLWVLTNVLGFMLSLLSIFTIKLVGPTGNGLSAAGLGLGLFLGGIQASVLRRRLPQLKVWHWIVATGLGTYIGSALAAFSNLLQAMTGQGILFIAMKFFPPSVESMPPALMWGILLIGHGISVGISVGIAQVLVLRQHTPNWQLWWTMSVLGYTLGGAVAFYGVWSIAGTFLDISWDSMVLVMRGLCLGAVGGVIYGSITAIALKSLRPRQHNL